jgi:hypothetical protein
MKFTLTIELGNDAMNDNEHIAGALRAVAGKLEGGRDGGYILDGNGNNVGAYDITEDPDDNPED